MELVESDKDISGSEADPYNDIDMFDYEAFDEENKFKISSGHGVPRIKPNLDPKTVKKSMNKRRKQQVYKLFGCLNSSTRLTFRVY